MSFDSKRLYELLPALYRIRDTELGMKLLTEEGKTVLEKLSESPDEDVQGPLRALLSIIAEQVTVLEENLEQLYDDQFIETCAEWAVFYIGELVGTRGLISIPAAEFTPRSEVANTISYRRRKGTASVIEQLARDITGWNANVVEYFQLLATTQYMNHLRLENLTVASLKNWKLLEYLNTPFDKMTHTVDVRRIEKKRGKYNIQNIGIFLWRLQNYLSTNAPAYKVDDRRYTFNPLGKDMQLYNFPETEDTITHLAEPVNVPIPLSRRVLANDPERYYGKDKSILIYANGEEVLPVNTSPPPVKLTDLISICDLSDVFDSGGVFMGWAHMPDDKIAIDPVLGRIAFPASQPPPSNVHVTYNYAFSAEMGGGEYDRDATFIEDPKRVEVIEVESGKITIQDALDKLATKGEGGVVKILDNEYYFETPLIKVAAGKTIELRSANKKRPVLVLDGEILIEAEENANVILNGLLMSGGRIRSPLRKTNSEPNNLASLHLLHCTLLPGRSPALGAIPAQPANPRIIVESPNTVVEIEKTITGPLRVLDGAKVFINNSIVDALEEAAVAYSGLSGEEPGGTLHITNSTIIGRVYTIIMELASNSIFTAAPVEAQAGAEPVAAQRLQEGCVRFSYVPPKSKLPGLCHCQPSATVDANRVRPIFTSLNYADPGYCQLSKHCAIEITQGANDEAEMGVFHDLYQPQREINLRNRLDEYLRFGLEAGIFYAS